MKNFLCLVTLCFFLTTSSAQSPRPKLVVGMVVDQMRWDFLYRYSDRYGNNGFKRLMNEGFNCENTFIPFTPTYTAPGHASVFTGSVPAFNGIVGNNWYDPVLKRIVYCAEDASVTTVGANSVAGKMSPRNMWSNTITDELRLATNFRNKTIAIALKDRGAILPGGHTANAAYWFDNATGGWISSSFYMQDLPEWVKKFNDRKLPDVYLKQNWQTLHPLKTYVHSTEDDKAYEDNLPGEDNKFSHKTDSLLRTKYESFRYTPYGNTYTFDMAKAAVLHENLGKRGVTDFLAISFSSTDYIGHAFGPNSIEVEDTYIRFDKEIGQFLNFLDATVGKGQYLFFLTADHGVAHIAGFNKERNLPGGNKDDVDVAKELNSRMQKTFGKNDLIASVINYQVYLNKNSLTQYNLDEAMVKKTIIEHLMTIPSVLYAFDLSQASTAPIPDELKSRIVNGYNQKLSGDIQFVNKTQWYDRWSRGTTHGSMYPYDAHIPLLWYGWKIKKGRSYREMYMTDIAPTLAALLQIQMPNASIGKVIEEIVK